MLRERIQDLPCKVVGVSAMAERGPLYAHILRGTDGRSVGNWAKVRSVACVKWVARQEDATMKKEG